MTGTTFRAIPKLLLGLLFLVSAPALHAQTTAFTYQGKLTDAGNPANGNFDLQFKLFDTATVGTGTQQGATLVHNPVAVSAGVFTVTLDFGANVFNGAPRFLEIGVRPAGSGNPYTVLAPRQPITTTPYAIQTLHAASADALTSACASCVTSGQIGSVNGSAVTGTIPVASVPGGSTSYVQNTTTQQASSNFNISGNGTAGGTLGGNIVNAATQYNLGGSRILSSPSNNNLFIGLNVAATGTTGIDNTYVGFNAGNASTTGSANSVFGVSAGLNNRGDSNSFFGRSAGLQTTTGSRNSLFGVQAGRDTTLGSDNSFFGYQAGISSTGFSNSFFGAKSGIATAGDLNAFFGYLAGSSLVFGAQNTFIGQRAGSLTTGGDNNTLIGADTQLNANNLQNATAIGANATVSTSNTLVLGSINGVNDATADTNVAIGATFGDFGRLTVLGGPTWTSAGWKSSLVLDNASAIGWFSNVAGNSRGIGQSNSGLYFFRTRSNPSFTGSPAVYNLVITDNDLVGIGTLTPDSTLTVNGGASKPGGGSWAVFSDTRLKNIHGNFTRGLADLLQLQPLRYEYKADNALGLRGAGEYVGFSAQAVQSVIPEAVSQTANGYLQVNNDPILWTMLNAIKEQQAQLQAQANQIEALKKLVCQTNSQAAACREQ